jgi:hypothetical protein
MEERFVEKLSKLSGSQESIQTLTEWVFFHKKTSESAVSCHSPTLANFVSSVGSYTLTKIVHVRTWCSKPGSITTRKRGNRSGS